MGIITILVGLAAAILLKAGKETHISGMVQDPQRRPLAGVFLIEKSRPFSRDYLWGGRVDDNGRFSIDVPEGGSYGLHLCATGYICHSAEVALKTGKINVFSFTLSPNAAEPDSPRISGVNFVPTENGKRVTISLTVNDPNNNLSYQVIGINLKTRQVFIFSPPAPVPPESRDYPNGLYTLQYIAAARPFAEKEWLFVAVDNRSYASPVVGYPFTTEGVIPGMIKSDTPRGEASSGIADLTAAPGHPTAAPELPDLLKGKAGSGR
ncbi:MAG: hypothetical protein QME75_11925 [Deltaproteobacteria bacterium]|nr:hypothetical protein [Deltaproteobacteria bacterium]